MRARSDAGAKHRGGALMLCRMLVFGFAMFWGLAAVVLAIGTFGWLGQPRDPLSGIYLILLGSPWVQIVSRIGWASPVSALLAPGANLLLIVLVCRRFGRRT